MASESHIPVLLKSTIDVMQPKPSESYLDLTAGYAGHAKEFLRQTQNYKEAVLVDRDDFAVKHLQRELPNVKIMQTDFYSAVSSLINNRAKFDLILMDLGVSSPQLDNAERGFSFRFDAPLDMRMDQGQGLTANQVVNTWRERDLVDILLRYGELRPGQAKKVARSIIFNRPVNTTGQLAGIAGFHLRTQVFQAIRIATNDELGLLERTLPLLPELLSQGGRLGIIAFHSLEDRLVKDFIKEHSSRGLESDLAVVTKKAISGSIEENSRSRGAKLRVARKI